MNARFSVPFGVKLGLAISLLSVGITTGSVYFFYSTTHQLILDQMQARLQTAGRLSLPLFDQAAKARIQRLKRSSEQASVQITPELLRNLKPGEAQPSLPSEVADRLMQTEDFQSLVQILRQISEASRTQMRPEQKIYPQPEYREPNNPVSIFTYLLVAIPESPDYRITKFICSALYQKTDNWPGNPIGNLFNSPDPVFAKTFRYGEPQFGETFFTDQWGSWLTVALPIKDDTGQVLAVVGLKYEGSSEANQLRHLEYVCFSIIAASMGLSIVAAYFLARWLGRPINKLQAAAQKVQNRDFSATVDLRTNDGLGLLAQAFNSMVAEIRTYATSLEEKNRELEIRVAERTAQLAQANVDLQNSETELQGLFAAMDDVVVVYDRQGRYLKVASTYSRLLFRPAAELLNRTVTDILPPDQAEMRLAWIQQVLETKQSLSSQFQLLINGCEIWFSANLSPLSEDTVIMVARDITGLKQIEVALQQSLNQLAAANQEITLLNRRLESENLRMSAELAVTRRLQQMILPKEAELSQIEGLEIAGFMEPADEVGGDYYDVLVHDGVVKIGIGDVTGHGLESGMLMIMLQTAVRTLLTNGETDPHRFLKTINQVIYENVQRMNSDKNLTLALLDYQVGQVKLSGQHEEILVVRANGVVERLDTIDLGFLLGLIPDIGDFIAEVEIQLQPGDGLVLYTDGITEAENGAKQYYGLERFCQIVSKNWQQPAVAIRQAIIEDLRLYIGEHRVYDDITLLILKQK